MPLKRFSVERIFFFEMTEYFEPSSETQGQIVGARESLNGRKNIYGTKKSWVKNGEKSPWGQCLTRSVPNGRRRSGFWLVPENLCFSDTNQKPEQRRPFGTGLVKTLSPGALLAVLYFSSFHIYFSARWDFPSPPLSAPGSPRMILNSMN